MGETGARSRAAASTTSGGRNRAEYSWNNASELIGVSAGWELGGGVAALRAMGLPQAAQDDFAIKIARDPLGQELARRMPGGIVSVWKRDRFGRAEEQRVLTGASSQSAGRDLARRAYAWSGPDEIGSIASLDTTTGLAKSGSQYEYDPRGHLIRQLFSNGEVLERASDAAGNLFRSADQTDRVYGKGGVLRKAGGTIYESDADGFLVKKTLSDGATWKYTWDAHGRLSEVARPDGKKVAFAYDAFGRRVSKTFEGRTTEYVWDGDDLVHERVRAADGSVASPVTTWVFEPGAFTPLAKLEGRKRYGVVTDHLGTPTMLATEAGKIAWQAQLDVYGVVREESLATAGADAAEEPERTTNPWRYPGQYEDAETGLYYNRFRYYDPETGRYLSEDPIGLAGGVGLTAYPANSVLWIDPVGLVRSWSLRETRTVYEQATEEVGRLGQRMLERGIPEREVAETVNAARNAIKENTRKGGPWLAEIFAKARNFVKYRNTLGPAVEDQLKKGKGLLDIIRDSGRSNERYNRACRS